MPASGSNGTILAADIGGTKVSIGLAAAGATRDLLDIRTYESRCYARFEDILSEDLSLREARPRRIALAVAGPVDGGAARITNLPWAVRSEEIRRGFAFASVALINDLEALAWAVPELEPSDLTTLQVGEHDASGALAVVAPGTGLGEAFLMRDAEGYTAHASEGGHADFAPSNALQARLLADLQEEFGHVSWERVCSGSGLPSVHRFLVEREGMTEVDAVAGRLASADDATPIIVTSALDAESEVCMQAVGILVDTLAAEAGNLALKVLASGGVFLGGGLPARILPFLQAPGFVEVFRAKGRFSDFLSRVPIHVVRDQHAVLRGAARCAQRGAQEGTL